MKLTKNMKTNIQSFKHNEQVHRIWRHTKIVEANDDFIVTAHRKSRVYEQSGRAWYTKEPAVCYFYKDKWFNVIVMFKKTGINYYCNIASPYLYDGEAIKYIDYDLDVKLFPDGTYTILDRNEFEHNSTEMNYPEELKDVLEKTLEELVEMIENKENPFNEDYVNNHYKEAFIK